MSIEEQLANIDRQLGIGADTRMLQAFRAAGFSEVDAVRGARLMESAQSRALGFEHVACELATTHHVGGAVPPSSVRKARIAEAARGLAEPAAAARTETPWGRPAKVAESSRPAGPWGRRGGSGGAPTQADFVAVGLSEAQAEESMEGLKSGRFVSYEDACLSVARGRGVTTLREDAMRRRARAFRPVQGE